MTFDEYQKQTVKTDLMPRDKLVPVTDPAFVAKILGLVGETGEAAEKFKKIIRDNDGKVSETAQTELVKELGDVLWYLSVLAKYLGVSFEEVAQRNLDKIHDRKVRGVARGSGDNR